MADSWGMELHEKVARILRRMEPSTGIRKLQADLLDLSEAEILERLEALKIKVAD
jgi:hypothetical protein